MNTIVVGIDGSDGARDALRWALREAHQHDADLRVVHVIPPPELAPSVADRVEARGADGARRRAIAEQVIDEALAALGDPADLAIDRVPVVDAEPAAVLISASRGADLLVVGSRGLGGFHGLLVGSVSHQCSTHAHCPTVVVPRGR